MATYTHQTAPTQFIKANGIQFAYRRFGKPGGSRHIEDGRALIRGSGNAASVRGGRLDLRFEFQYGFPQIVGVVRLGRLLDGRTEL